MLYSKKQIINILITLLLIILLSGCSSEHKLEQCLEIGYSKGFNISKRCYDEYNTAQIKDRFSYCEVLGYENTLLATDYTNDFYCVNVREDKSIGDYEYINWDEWR